MVTTEEAGDAEATGQQDPRLIEAIVSSWFRVISSAELEIVVDSMHRTRRCKAIIKAQGCPTRY